MFALRATFSNRLVKQQDMSTITMITNVPWSMKMHNYVETMENIIIYQHITVLSMTPITAIVIITVQQLESITIVKDYNFALARQLQRNMMYHNIVNILIPTNLINVSIANNLQLHHLLKFYHLLHHVLMFHRLLLHLYM